MTANDNRRPKFSAFLLSFPILVLLGLPLLGCPKEDRDVGDKVEDAIEDAADELGDAAEEASDKVKEIKDDVKEAVEGEGSGDAL